MKLGALRGAGFLIVSLLLKTVVGHDVPLDRRQEDGLVFDPVTITVTIFTQFTFTETTTTTVDPTQSTTSVSTPIVTVTSTERTTTTTTGTTTKTITIEPKETGDSDDDDKRKRQVGTGPITVTSTATLWQFPDATETSTVTVTASPQTIESPPEVSPTTTTQITTETSTVTAEETVTTSITLATSSASATGSKLLTSLILEGDHDGREDEKISGPHLAIILGATFGAVLGAVILFAVAYLWTKKRRDERLEKEFYGESARPPPKGKGIKGFIASVLDGTRFTTRYNTLPNTDRSAMSLQNRPFFPPLPSHSPPPQLPALRVDPPYDYTFTARSSRPPQLPSLHITPQPGTDFTCEYTFGSPVSSIGETHLHSLTSTDGMEAPLPLVPRTSEQAQPKKGKEIVSVVPLTSEPPPTSTGGVGSGVLPKMSIKRKPVP